MKNTVKVALAGAAIVAGMAGGVMLATPASADVYGHLGDHSGYAYLSEMHDDGLTGGTSAQASDLAVSVCDARSNGTSEDGLIRGLENRGETSALSVTVVMAAEWHFCPAYTTTYNSIAARGGSAL